MARETGQRGKGRSASGGGASGQPASGQVSFDHRDQELTITLRGRLDARSMGSIWRVVISALDQWSPDDVVVVADEIDYCDGSGAAIFFELARRFGDRYELRSFPGEYRPLLDLYAEDHPAEIPPVEDRHPLEELGRASMALVRDMRAQIAFTGELLVALLSAVRHPQRFRMADALYVAETAGVNAVPIVVLIGFLLGLILAFQSAMPMREFGAEIYVANLLGVSLIKELGPLMTAILLAGRTGSSFAAEIGTMKVNEEIDALTTMGLDPVRFLAVTRVTATMIMMPLLTCFCIFSGLAGGAIVMVSMGFPLVLYIDRLFTFVTLAGFAAAMIKSLVFALLVAGIGCLRGLRTTTGAKAVGESTTSAVVSGILLIALADAAFAVVLYSLDI